MQQFDPGHTIIMPMGAVAAALRLASVPSLAGGAFAMSREPVATVEVLRGDGGWLVAQHDLAGQFG